MKYPLNMSIVGYQDRRLRPSVAGRGTGETSPSAGLRFIRPTAASTLNKRETRKYMTGHDTMCARADAKTPPRAQAPSIAVQLLYYDTYLQ